MKYSLTTKIIHIGSFSLLILLILPFHSRPASADSYEEHQIKAAFLFNFPHFVKWPNEKSKPAPLTRNYCVLQDGAVESALKSLISISENDNIQRSYIELSDLKNLSNCDMLYLGERDIKNPEDILDLANGKDILTVSDQPNFIRDGGMIELVRQGSRVQVHINLDSVNEQGFDISSKLLRLAKVKASESMVKSDD